MSNSSKHMNTFRYVIMPDRTYTLILEDYDGHTFDYEVSGDEILATFRRGAILEKQLEMFDNEDIIWPKSTNVDD